MTTNSIVSDSSFYIAFMSPKEINDIEILTEILKRYEFFIGKIVLKEISVKHGDLLEKIKLPNLISISERYDYSALLSVIGDKIFKKGEYECMAIAHYLSKKSKLHLLIIDDSSARNFVENNIPSLNPFMKYTLRFIVDGHCLEQKISRKKSLIILDKVKQAILDGGRPFNLTEKNIGVIDQLLKEVDGCQK